MSDGNYFAAFNLSMHFSARSGCLCVCVRHMLGRINPLMCLETRSMRGVGGTGRCAGARPPFHLESVFLRSVTLQLRGFIVCV